MNPAWVDNQYPSLPWAPQTRAGTLGVGQKNMGRGRKIRQILQPLFKSRKNAWRKEKPPKNNFVPPLPVAKKCTVRKLWKAVNKMQSPKWTSVHNLSLFLSISMSLMIHDHINEIHFNDTYSLTICLSPFYVCLMKDKLRCRREVHTCRFILHKEKDEFNDKKKHNGGPYVLEAFLCQPIIAVAKPNDSANVVFIVRLKQKKEKNDRNKFFVSKRQWKTQKTPNWFERRVIVTKYVGEWIKTCTTPIQKKLEDQQHITS